MSRENILDVPPTNAYRSRCPRALCALGETKRGREGAQAPRPPSPFLTLSYLAQIYVKGSLITSPQLGTSYFRKVRTTECLFYGANFLRKWKLAHFDAHRYSADSRGIAHRRARKPTLLWRRLLLGGVSQEVERVQKGEEELLALE